MKNILLCFISLLATYVSASVEHSQVVGAEIILINTIEEEKLNNINSKYNLIDGRSEIANLLSSINIKSRRVEETHQIKSSMQKQYDDLLKSLQQILAYPEIKQDAFWQIKNIAAVIEQIKIKESKLQSSIKAEQSNLTQAQNNLKLQSDARSYEILHLKSEIENRITRTLKQPVNIVKSGLVKCPKNKNILDCIESKKTNIVNGIVNNYFFLDKGSKLNKFNVTNASLNLKGELQYEVSLKFTSSYNENIDLAIFKSIGLNTAKVTLQSNEDVNWFVDGLSVGKGMTLTLPINIGKHTIVAQSKNGSASTSSNISESVELFYNIKGKTHPLDVDEKTKKNTESIVKSKTPPLDAVDKIKNYSLNPVSKTKKSIVKIKTSQTTKLKHTKVFVGSENKFMLIATLQNNEMAKLSYAESVEFCLKNNLTIASSNYIKMYHDRLSGLIHKIKFIKGNVFWLLSTSGQNVINIQLDGTHIEKATKEKYSVICQ